MNAIKLMSQNFERARSKNSNFMLVVARNRGILQNLNSFKLYAAVLVLGLLFGAGATHAQSVIVTFDEYGTAANPPDVDNNTTIIIDLSLIHI